MVAFLIYSNLFADKNRSSGMVIKRIRPAAMCSRPDCEGGGYLLSHFRSTIGVAGFNFSVRNGKRWSPRAMATLVFSFPVTGTYRPAGMGQVGSTLEAMTYLFYSRLLLSYTITCYLGDYTPRKGFGLLVLLGCGHCCPCTCNLSTS